MSGLAVLVGIYLLPILLLLGLLGVVYAVVSYNHFVKLGTTVESTWSDVDVQLTKRSNLLPNLVDTVRGYAGHEKGVFQEISALRAQAVKPSSVAEKARIEETLNGMVRNLFAVAENYPALKADVNFQQLQKTLQELENTIESGRRSYNAAVRRYNILLNSFPARLVGRRFGFAPRPFFEFRGGDDERTLPKVEI